MNTKTRKELTQFFIITFAISWLIWLPGILIPNFPIPGKAMEVIGAIAPAMVALILIGRAESKAGLKRMVANSFGKKCNWKFLLLACLMLLGLHAASRLIYSMISTNLPQSDMLSSPISVIPLFIIMFLLGGGLNEEIGWRGYALDRIQTQFTALAASLFLGVFWIVWHLPVFFLPGTNQSLIPFWLFLVAVIPLGVMMTWVYNNTNQSIFAAAFFHTIGNLAHELFRVMPTEASPSLTGFIILTILYYLAAAVIVGLFGAKTLQNNPKMRNKKTLVLTSMLLLTIFLSACQSQPTITTQADLEQTFQDTLDTLVEDNDNVHNAVIMVQGPDFTWKGAAGMADPETGLEMLPDDQFRTASSAKMMLATLTLKLAEMGLVDLDTPIAEYLYPEIMDGLHIYEGIDYSDQLTTRHLLHHTSGLADNWDDERDEGHFLHMVLEIDPDRFWEPEETIVYVKENLPPLFAPGEDVHYSDINFQLAGLVIESITGEQLHEVYREYLFEPLGMEHTYMELREKPHPSLPGRTLSHVYYEGFDYTNNRAISADWAGGGLVTTTTDMNRFMNAFVKNEIFSNSQTREAMFDWMEWTETIDYGLGIMRIQGKTLTIWGHLGVGNAMMFYWPDGDVILTGTLNQQDINSGIFMSQILKAVENYQPNN